ncbi:MAG TPA: PilZ domain-containing protein [Blastocatellia bacterium]|nr:PilZ domain-containing protein [Blastocatellia bacterium]
MKTAEVIDRRESRRFHVSWQIVVRGFDKRGARFETVGALDNLSSGGAFFYIDRSLPVGAQLDVMINVPLKRDNWMRYSAKVLRAESGETRFGLAARFETLIPAFSRDSLN